MISVIGYLHILGAIFVFISDFKEGVFDDGYLDILSFCTCLDRLFNDIFLWEFVLIYDAVEKLFCGIKQKLNN